MYKLGLVFVLLAAIASGCCGLDENRKSREAFLGYAAVIDAESAYVLDNNLIDPVALATAEDGTFNKEVCIEHSKMLEHFKQDLPAMAQAMRQWAEGNDVSDPVITEVDHEARCSQ